jgi:hypothetical protein
VPSRYGEIELVLDGTPESPNEQHVAAIQAFIPHAGETIERLRRCFRFLFFGVQFVSPRTSRTELAFSSGIAFSIVKSYSLRTKEHDSAT